MTAKKNRTEPAPVAPTRDWQKGARRGDYQYIDGHQWMGFARFVVAMEGPGPDSAEGHANLRLALAAPDMLEVLEDSLAALEVESFDSTWAQGRMRAVINKARGR